MNTNNQALVYWAERTVKSDAWDRAKSLRGKRGGNPFSYSNSAITRLYFAGLTVEEFVAQRDAYIAAHPMTYSPTTERFAYVKAVA